MVSGKIDGGIRPSAYPAFQDWLEETRHEMGVLGVDGVERAFSDKNPWAETYQHLRDWAEFEASGLDLTKFLSPKDYAIVLFELVSSMLFTTKFTSYSWRRSTP
jgi:hypothetical protein